MNGLFYLAHLVQTKNDLNRKRRRFWNLAFNTHRYYQQRYVDGSRGNFRCVEVKLPKAFTKATAQQGYILAKMEMKAMTALMRKTRKEFDARFEWSDHGAIRAIHLCGKRYNEAEIAKLAECYNADKILLGDNHA